MKMRAEGREDWSDCTGRRQRAQRPLPASNAGNKPSIFLFLLALRVTGDSIRAQRDRNGLCFIHFNTLPRSSPPPANFFSPLPP